jgi:hypothetical protein
MQPGSLKRKSRKRGPDIWQFRWSENSRDGKRFYHKKIVGTVEQYPDCCDNQENSRDADTDRRIRNGGRREFRS